MITMLLTEIRCENVDWLNWLRIGFSAKLLQGASIVTMLRATQSWPPPSLLSNGKLGFLPHGVNSWGVKLTTHLHPMPRVRMSGAAHLTPLYAHTMVRNNFTFFVRPYKCGNESSCSIKLWTVTRVVISFQQIFSLVTRNSLSLTK